MHLALILPDWFFHDTGGTIAAVSAGTDFVLHHKATVILVASTKSRHTLFDAVSRCLNLVTATSTTISS